MAEGGSHPIPTRPGSVDAPGDGSGTSRAADTSMGRARARAQHLPASSAGARRTLGCSAPEPPAIRLFKN